MSRVAVIITALNEAGKIGRVLDKFPHDGRFEAIVVDDGSTDGTGDEARTRGAALVIRHEQRGGIGGAIRDGWKAGIDRNRPYLALLSGDDQHEPSELEGALDALLAADAEHCRRTQATFEHASPYCRRRDLRRVVSPRTGLLPFRV
jgi:glycosyltransferase involved in cell wall biosynthesis